MPPRRHAALTKDDVLSKILELDLKKIEMRHEREMWHIKSMWGGLTGLLVAGYLAVTVQYFSGNQLFVRYNYMIVAGILLLFLVLCYGLMWIEVIKEYKKFERIINDRIEYYDTLLNDEKKSALFDR